MSALPSLEAPGTEPLSAVQAAGLTYRFGTAAHLGLDAVVLVIATVAGVTASSLLLPRLAR